MKFKENYLKSKPIVIYILLKKMFLSNVITRKIFIFILIGLRADNFIRRHFAKFLRKHGTLM